MSGFRAFALFLLRLWVGLVMPEAALPAIVSRKLTGKTEPDGMVADVEHAPTFRDAEQTEFMKDPPRSRVSLPASPR